MAPCHHSSNFTSFWCALSRRLRLCVFFFSPILFVPPSHRLSTIDSITASTGNEFTKPFCLHIDYLLTRTLSFRPLTTAIFVLVSSAFLSCLSTQANGKRLNSEKLLIYVILIFIFQIWEEEMWKVFHYFGLITFTCTHIIVIVQSSIFLCISPRSRVTDYWIKSSAIVSAIYSLSICCSWAEHRQFRCMSGILNLDFVSMASHVNRTDWMYHFEWCAFFLSDLQIAWAIIKL